MSVVVAEKYSASMDEDLLAEAREMAEEEGVTLSAYLAETVRKKVQLRRARQALDEYQAIYGAFTDEEMAEAADWFDNGAQTPEEILREADAKKAQEPREPA